MAVVITFDLSQISGPESKALVSLLQAVQERDVVMLVPQTATADGTEAEEPSQEVVPETPTSTKPRRGRPRKDATAIPALPTPEEESHQEATSTTVGEIVTSGAVSKEYSVSELRDKLKVYTEKYDVQAGISLLNEFGCARVSDMASQSRDVQAAFVSKCDA